MKKILSLALALAMIGTALTGCGSKDAATKTPAENTQQTAPVQQEQSQTEKALALINTFATGDTDTARSLLADGYIQHNLAYGTGADAFIGSVDGGKSVKGALAGPAELYEKLGVELADILLDDGGRGILDEVYCEK